MNVVSSPPEQERLTVLSGRRTSHLEVVEPLRMKIVEGTAYVTQEGDFRDYIVRTGETISLTSGLVVVQGFPDVAFKVCA